ncbi:MAG: ribose ABC transporter permease [Anaerolinea sp.]|nr:ribose ABC transporter permease [Anaerolinea sp.]
MNNSFLQRFLSLIRTNSGLVILLLVALPLSALSADFITVNNLLTVALQTSMIAIAAIGMTFALITGGVDLSVGSVAALTGALAAGLSTRAGLETYPAILLALFAAVLVGALNGAMIAWGRIPPFVATLASMAAVRGLTLVYTQGRPISGLDEQFTFWATNISGIPVPLFVLLFVAIITYVVLHRSVFGNYIFAIGGGEETARLAGISPVRIKLGVYIISALCAGLTGLLLTARLWSAQPNSGIGLELDAIASSVLGGASLMGGAGSVGGALTGTFIIGILANGLNLLEVPSYNQQVIKGLVFIIAVILDYVLKRRLKKV